MIGNQIIALLIFIVTYLGIIFNKLPFINLDRKAFAFVGAVLMIVCGVIDFDFAIQSIDFNTIVLLLGMMIIISVLKFDGFFEFISYTTTSHAKNPSALLSVIVFITGFASAFLVNDAVVLLFTPVIINICRQSKLNPIPFLLGEIFSANAGSLMTITGNPQNMIIGIASHISYAKFMICMLPIALLSMLVIIFVIKKTNRDIFSNKASINISQQEKPRQDLKRMRLSLIVFGLVVLGFFFGKILGISIPVIAIAGASIILLLSKHKSKEVLQEVDFSLLIFFVSLFILVAGIKQSGVLDFIFNISLQENVLSVLILFALSVLLSQLLSNVPYTVFMLPLMNVAHSEVLWLTLASASTLAGNLTIVGAMANLIVIEEAGKENVFLSSKHFLRPAVLITSITSVLALLFSLVLLLFR